MNFFIDNSAERSRGRRSVRLLIVDDPCEHADLLLEMAEMYHPEYEFACKLVEDASLVLQMVSDWNPNVVLVDLHVLDDPFDVVQRVSSLGSSVIAASETNIPDLEVKISECGGSGYVIKSSILEDVEVMLDYLGNISQSAGSKH